LRLSHYAVISSYDVVALVTAIVSCTSKAQRTIARSHNKLHDQKLPAPALCSSFSSQASGLEASGLEEAGKTTKAIKLQDVRPFTIRARRDRNLDFDAMHRWRETCALAANDVCRKREEAGRMEDVNWEEGVRVGVGASALAIAPIAVLTGTRAQAWQAANIP
jgi:hypothetical protein